MQVVKAAEHIQAPDCEDGGGDGVRHYGSTIRDNLRRKIQLVLRHRFAFAQLTQDCPDAPEFFAHRSRRARQKPLYENNRNSGEHQFGNEGECREITK